MSFGFILKGGRITATATVNGMEWIKAFNNYYLSGLKLTYY